MATAKEPRPYLNPYVAGTLLGVVLFATFFVLHVYLVSTGRTPTDHLKSMITGYQHVEVDGQAPEGAER